MAAHRLRKHSFIVAIEVDASNPNAPSSLALRDEIRSNLEFEAHSFGVKRVNICELIEPVAAKKGKPHA